jgi:hypothetical protein
MTEGESKKNQSETKGNRTAATGRAKGRQQQQSQGKAILNSNTTTPMLKYGAGNNFDLFKKQVVVACMENYKNLGKLIDDKQFYVPPPVDVTLFDLSNSPHKIENSRLWEAT